MISRVFTNKNGYITLDSDIFGERKRFSTGKKEDKRLLSWYEKHFDSEYRKLYEKKCKPEQSESFTFKTYGELVLKITAPNRSAFSQKNVTTVFNNLCNFFGEMRIDLIKSTDIMRWQHESGYASKTVLNHRAYMNLIMQTAMNDDIIKKNPVPLVKAPKKISVRKTTVYYELDMKKLISTAKGQFKNYIQLCFFSGLRGSEMIALRWKEDIDFENGIITVSTRIRDGVEDLPKSGRIRHVPMFEQARSALMEQRRRTGLSEFVFLNQSGVRYQTPDTLTVSFKKIAILAGVESGTIHDLRRSFNTLLKQYSYPPDWILDVMGHVDETVNRNHYTGKLDVDMDKLGKISL